MSEQTQKTVELEIDLGPRRVDSTWILLHGRTGLGKTLYMTGIVHACIKFWANLNHAKILLITNYHIYKLPDSVTVFRSGSVREIMEKMMACEGTGIRVIVAIDEINNTLSSKQSATNMSTWLTRVASNARKYGVVAFIFSTQGKKASDYRLRVNCTFFATPRGDCNVDKRPMATWWKDSGEWDVDTTYAKRDIFGRPLYEYGVPIPSDYELEYLRDAYNTSEVLPIELDPTVKEDEAPMLTDRFIAWSSDSQVGLDEMNKSDVMAMVRRWNRSVFVIPYSPSGEQVIYTELLKRGLLRERFKKEEKEEVNEEKEVKKEKLSSLPVHSDADNPESNSVDEEPQSSAPVTENERDVKDSPITSDEEINIVPSRPELTGDTQLSVGSSAEKATKNYLGEFCCGRWQTNKYTHRKTKMHLKSLKSVEGGQPETVKENGRETS